MTHVHFIGIGGTGLSAIALVLLQRGFAVSGSDRQSSPALQRLEKAGAQIALGHRAENIEGADVVLRSSAVSDDNVEVVAARTAGIPVLKRSDYLPQFLAGYRTIAVAGTHGKTTTTAMIAWVMQETGLDPSYIIGGTSLNLDANAHAGSSDYFVIEADEYDRMFLGLHPQVAVVTNIEYDHPDCFPTPQDFHQTFEAFSRQVLPGGVLIACADDAGSLALGSSAVDAGRKVLLYGLDGIGVDFQAQAVRPNDRGGYSFIVCDRDSNPLAQVVLRVPGLHNVRNALASLVVAGELGLPWQPTADILGEFSGAGRRFEVRGEAGGVTLIDDYAHHPTEIRATLAAARARYGQRRLWAVWQPHTFSRTRTLFGDFCAAFADADRVTVTEIYAAREAVPQDGFSARDVVRALVLQQNMAGKSVSYAATLDKAVEQLEADLIPGDVLILLSAGDANQIGDRLLSSFEKRKHKTSMPLRYLDMYQPLKEVFGNRLQANVGLARYTSARLGGPADLFLQVDTAEELAQAVGLCWQHDLPLVILGGGSNVLVSDTGVRGLVVLNRARKVRFNQQGEPPTVWAESGANFGVVARQAARRGLAGLEWAAGIPGTVGGAVVGNAGAHGGDMAGNLQMAEILHRNEGKLGDTWTREEWRVPQFEYAYRSSVLKTQPGKAVVLAALLQLQTAEAEEVIKKMEDLAAYRKRTQPPGASMGSMFKNPPGDYAGRLIEAAGLKGTRMGSAEISPVHANFFVNHGRANAADVFALVQHARKEVAQKFGVLLELEIELVGEWQRGSVNG